MRVAICQPHYLPWPGFFALMDSVDVFVLLDTVPISRQSWQTRNRIRLRDGRTVWLSVPITARAGQRLDSVEIDYSRDWRTKHWRTIEAALSGAGCFEDLAWLEIAYDVGTIEENDLAHYTGRLIRMLAWHIGIDTDIVRASTLPQQDGKIGRLAAILDHLDATSYVTTLGATYLKDLDNINGVPIEWQGYQPSEYRQAGLPFQSHLSIVDMVAHCGADTLGIIRQGVRATTPNKPATTVTV